jgi:hypothetical protein
VRTYLTTFALSLALVTASYGRADATPPGMTPPSHETAVPPLPQASADSDEGERYGHYMLLADAATMSMSIAAESGELFLASYLLTGAVVHFANGEVGRGLGSIGLRAGLPLVGGLAGAAAADGCSGELCGLGHIAVGMMLGMGTALVVDWVALARKSGPERRHSKGTPTMFRFAGVRANPTLAPTRKGGLAMGLTGSF